MHQPAKPGPDPSPPDMPPFERLGPPDAATPLVIAVAHAGRSYPPALLAASAGPRELLEQLEDRHADLLVADAVTAGAVAVVARTARAWIDLNRGPEDLDPALRDPAADRASASRRARSGLGLLPLRLGATELWRVPPGVEEAAHRLAAAHAPFHAAIGEALEAAVRRHGFAVLLDCHSMPPLRGLRPARVVVGDLHGRTAGEGLAAGLVRFVRGQGYPAALNAPYAGAYTLRRHGRPEAHVHAVQLEIDRALYLRSDLRTPSPGVEAIRRLVAAVGAQAVALLRSPAAIAAE